MVLSKTNRRRGIVITLLIIFFLPIRDLIDLLQNRPQVLLVKFWRSFDVWHVDKVKVIIFESCKLFLGVSLTSPYVFSVCGSFSALMKRGCQKYWSWKFDLLKRSAISVHTELSVGSTGSLSKLLYEELCGVTFCCEGNFLLNPSSELYGILVRQIVICYEWTARLID